MVATITSFLKVKREENLTILYAENLDLVGGGDSGGCN